MAPVGWATVESMRLLPGRMARSLPSRRPKLLNRADQVGAVRLANKIKHASRAISSKLLVQSASERLLLWPAALEGCIRHGLSGTRAAEVSFGGGCRALYPLIPELLNIGGQRSRAGRLELRRGGLQDLSRGWLQECRWERGRQRALTHTPIRHPCIRAIRQPRKEPNQPIGQHDP